MTNTQIILYNMAELIAEGIITENNTINTWDGWRRRGYRVKRGEKHIAEFRIWMPKTKKQKQRATTEEQETAEENSGFYKKMAYWFTDKQVERI